MSSKPHAVSGSSANGFTPPPAPKKEESKAKKPTQVALSALAEATAHSLYFGEDLESSPAEKLQAVQSAMQLKATTSANKPDLTPLTIKFTPQETTLLNTIFGSWALNQQLTLLDVWGVDLFAHFEKLIPYFDEGARLLIQEFTGKFLLGYVGFLNQAAARTDEEVRQIPLYQRGMPSNRYYVMMTQQEWRLCLEDLKQKIGQLEQMPKAKIKTIKKLLENVKQRLDLGCKFLADKDAIVFLCDSTLCRLESHFPKSSALSASYPFQKSLEDLTTYVRFVETGFNAGCEKGILSMRHPFLGRMNTHLEALSKSQNKIGLIRDVKKELGPLFSSMHEQTFDLAQSCELARAGRLSHEQFCKKRGIQMVTQKSQEDFIISLYFKFAQMNLCNALVHDCLDIFDERIMMDLYPQKFVPTYVGFRRLTINIDYFLQKQFSSTPPGLLPTPPSSSNSGALTVLVGEMQHDLEFWNELVNPTTFMKAATLFSYFKQQERTHYNEWIPLIELCQPIVKAVEASLPTLNKVRIKYLEKIEGFLRKLSPQELRQDREKWTAYFKEVAFIESLDFCRVSMLSRDLDALSQFKTDLNALCSEEHLLSEPVVDFMELEGIEQLFSKLLTPHHPMIEDLEDKPVKLPPNQKVAAVAQPILTPVKPAPPKRIEKVEKDDGKTQPIVPRSSFALEEAPAPFVISRGEKTRKILSRLRGLGFLPVSQRGSHLKLEDEKGQPVIVPVGGKRAHQKRGTGRSIASQASGKH